jgi:hypothetical protein
MCDMMILAFQTDSTRVATMLFAGEGSNRTFSELGFSEGHPQPHTPPEQAGHD